MNRLLHILTLSLTMLLLQGRAQAQDLTELPWACAGTTEAYWVKGINGISNFDWRVYFNTSDSRTDVTDEILSYINSGGDSVLISWPEDPMRGGMYTFEVIETTAYGCIGTVYSQDIVVNSSSILLETFDDVPESFWVCVGQEAVLDPGANFVDYLWQDKSINRTYITTEAGTYEVRLTRELLDAEERKLQFCSFATIEAGFHPLPEVFLGKDTLLFGAQSILLNASSAGIAGYQWFKYDFDQKNWNEQLLSANNSTFNVEGGLGKQWVSVFVTDVNGCVNSDSILVESADYNKFRIPAAFIPGSNNPSNQKWHFPAPSEYGTDLYNYLDDVEVHVFNRWGKLVWRSTGAYKPWDGRDLSNRPLPMDSYHYIIRIKVDGKVFEYKGAVTIVR